MIDSIQTMKLEMVYDGKLSIVDVTIPALVPSERIGFTRVKVIAISEPIPLPHHYAVELIDAEH